MGLPVSYSDRKTPVKGSDLVIQTGFAKSNALMDAIERRIPYIIMEEPLFRGFYPSDQASSWGYNGLAGGAWRPEPPCEERPKPKLLPRKTAGGTLIIGQKPTDHSLRGSDHVKWLLDRFIELPEADFRPHPLMVPPGSLPPLERALSDIQTLVVYNSTTAIEGFIEGCEVRVDGFGHLLSPAGAGREVWLHALSWAQGTHNQFSDLAPHILSGYDEALDLSRRGLVEHPREKVDGQAVCKRYYKEIGDWGIR